MSLDEPTTALGDANLLNDDGAAEAEAFDLSMREQIEFNKERAALNAKISAGRKRMKARGIILGKLDATIRMMEWSPAEVREDFAVSLRYAKLAKLPIGSQIDAFKDAEDDEVAEADWYSRGYSSAVTGKGTPGVPPPECPPEFHQNWLEGWGDGQLKNMPFGERPEPQFADEE